MSIAVKGIYKSGKIKLLEELKGIEEADVIVVVTKKRKKEGLNHRGEEGFKRSKTYERRKVAGKRVAPSKG